MNTKPIYLTGYRGTGKSTVAQLIADRLECRSLDLDKLIEDEAQQSIRQIFESGGESAFRDYESACLEKLAQSLREGEMRVIALGGGAILSAQNRATIRETGVCVWLTASAETLSGRLAADATTATSRPALTELTPAEEIAALLAAREPLYRESADFRVATDDATPREVAEAVLTWWRSRQPDG